MKSKIRYESDIVLGERYRDRLHGLEGTAESVHFYRNACERVVVAFVHDGELKTETFDAVDLVHVDTERTATSPRTGGPGRTMPAPR